MLLAGSAYVTQRHPNNRISAPTDWDEVPGGQAYDPTTGFESVAYRKGDEIVIAFAGTDEVQDWYANVGMGLGGFGLGQLKAAAAFYAKIRAQYGDDVTYTFTGHSLGGGIAALMGVFFDKTAETFDPAPFRQAANNDTRTILRDHLEGQTGADGQSLLSTDLSAVLDSFWSSQPANGEGASAQSGIRGEGSIGITSVQGEVLLSVAPGYRIGFNPTIIPHASTTASGVDLHSIGLLAAMKLVPDFAAAAERLPNLIPLIFDPNLYKFAVTDMRTNFMELLVRGQTGIGGQTGNELLEKFAADMSRLASVGGRLVSEVPLNKALIAFGIQAYYDGDSTFAGNFFESVGGGLKFNIDKVANGLSGNKGYLQYFQSWFWPQVGGDDARLAFGAQLTNANDWYIAGDHLVADAGQISRRVFMLGAEQTDSLTGGTQSDLLVGLDGNDILDGGAGSDVINGGAGDDFIFGGGNVTVGLSEQSGPYSYNRFADGEVVMLSKDAAGQLILPGNLSGVSGTDSHVSEALAYHVEGDGADAIDGGDGNDWVLAGEGADVVEGGAGKDTLFTNFMKVGPGGTAANDGEWRAAA